jgi:CRP/FNR family cyclic AMP-dependent transcriptional regulator
MLSGSRYLGNIYRDGDVVCRQGELGECMYMVQEGRVEIMVRRGDKEFCLGMLEKGDFFGEATLLEQAVRPATLRAVGDAVVLTVEKKAFLHRLHEDPSFAVKIIRKMSRRIHQLEQSLMRSADMPELEVPVASKETSHS